MSGFNPIKRRLIYGIYIYIYIYIYIIKARVIMETCEKDCKIIIIPAIFRVFYMHKACSSF